MSAHCLPVYESTKRVLPIGRGTSRSASNKHVALKAALGRVDGIDFTQSYPWALVLRGGTLARKAAGLLTRFKHDKSAEGRKRFGWLF
jgi:hypothetical protein